MGKGEGARGEGGGRPGATPLVTPSSNTGAKPSWQCARRARETVPPECFLQDDSSSGPRSRWASLVASPPTARATRSPHLHDHGRRLPHGSAPPGSLPGHR
ncbi:hypothetical protein D187_002879 [Cystobacter fuscus DSM 2262]|uniref:Uncharacterized protein n=1 Tax=Cystobacter fuscus (strain ATCC 25194 / DSM 2262 / NBRC 100088 / M29) TaxID=1242864 RepID=S9QDF9_CYSF2|nr:hypothetical protein D187_002879 [Cystobacter fuscus DSM 2262]